MRRRQSDEEGRGEDDSPWPFCARRCSRSPSVSGRLASLVEEMPQGQAQAWQHIALSSASPGARGLLVSFFAEKRTDTNNLLGIPSRSASLRPARSSRTTVAPGLARATARTATSPASILSKSMRAYRHNCEPVMHCLLDQAHAGVVPRSSQNLLEDDEGDDDRDIQARPTPRPAPAVHSRVVLQHLVREPGQPLGGAGQQRIAGRCIAGPQAINPALDLCSLVAVAHIGQLVEK